MTPSIASRPASSDSNSAVSYSSIAVIEARIRSRRVPVAAGSSEARCSTAATTPARSANGSVPRSNRQGTESGAGASLSGCRVSSSPGLATTAPTCGPGPLVGAGRVEVGTERGDVDRPVRCRVHAVDVAEGADLVGTRGDRGDVRPGADEIARRRDRDEPGALRQQLLVLSGGKLTARRVDLGPADDRAGTRGGLDPRAARSHRGRAATRPLRPRAPSCRDSVSASL